MTPAATHPGRPHGPDGPHVVVVGGGLAGLAAALECADRGARVTILERRNRLGGLTWSFRHADRWVDNGQHVFLRCCDEYLGFLGRIGARGEVELPGRLDIPVVAPATRPGQPPRLGWLRRNDLPAPLHLAGSLLRYPHLPVSARLSAARAMLGLRRLDPGRDNLDGQTFASWLSRHGQTPETMSRLWDLITVPTVNLPAAEASLAMAAKVFQTGLLHESDAADIGWSRVPLGRLHGERAAAALDRAGVEVRLGVRVQAIEGTGTGSGPASGRAPRFSVMADGGQTDADAVIAAVPHDVAGSLLPPGTVAHQDRLQELGASPIVDVHLVFDRRVTDWPLMAGLGSPPLWVFDRTLSSEMTHEGDRQQYLAVSISAADEFIGRHPDELVQMVRAQLDRLLPGAARARLVDSLVTKERNATFRARPGTAALRPGAATTRPGLALAGAWTDTGWPATMEGAVRSGRAAANAVLAGSAGSAGSAVLAGSVAATGTTGTTGRDGRTSTTMPQPTDTEEVA